VAFACYFRLHPASGKSGYFLESLLFLIPIFMLQIFFWLNLNGSFFFLMVYERDMLIIELDFGDLLVPFNLVRPSLLRV
jgi:hypothetical protein